MQVWSLGGKNPSRKRQPTPVFLPGGSHGQRSLVGYSLWGHRRVGCDLVTKRKQQPWQVPQALEISVFPSLKWRYTTTFLRGLLTLHTVICKQVSSEILVLLSLLFVHFKVQVLHQHVDILSVSGKPPSCFYWNGRKQDAGIHDTDNYRPQLPSPG